MEMAYGVRHYQLSGPNWIVDFSSTDCYDVVAKARNPIRGEQLRRMLGPLLAERFRLAFHRETRELPVYTLVVAKKGPKFQRGDGGIQNISADGTGGYAYENYSMATLANMLSLTPAVGRPVLDRTGLEGGYNFTANLYNTAKDASALDLKRATVDNEGIFSAVQDQLGLKLEARKAPIEILAIDRAEKVPIEN
jgi:uncharacterized protein (TIGR03435 family)